MPVIAPYNFVPLERRVFLPNWAQCVSLDIPFKDYQSGYIEVTVEAKTPIFVRNGHCRGVQDNTFSHIIDENGKEKYFIPASTMKGAIRNVLKILSFGKMQIDKNLAIAQREFNNPNLYPLRDNANEQNRIKGGWLRRDENGDLKIYPAKFYRIALSRIDSKFGCKFKDYFSNDSDFNINETCENNGLTFDPKSAAFKYYLFKQRSGEDSTVKYNFTEDEQNGWNRVKFCDGGNIEGYLVFTGQSAKTKWIDSEDLDNINSDDRNSRRTREAKFYDFVFTEPVNDSKIDVPEELFEQYDLYMYKDNIDWENGIKKLESTPGMPVFYRIGDNGKIQDFGLTYLYKLPYSKTPLEIAQEQARDKNNNKINWNDPDLAEVMFGYSNETSSLKGRVHFSHFWGKGDITVGEEIPLTLSNPKVSYYPTYIKQEGNNGTTTKYRTYNDGTISGWKRYVLKNNKDNSLLTDNNEDPNRDSRITPINSGKFSGRVMFHNLNKIELGALLSALTFHGNNKNCFHQIGQGKPYGFGRISLSIDSIMVNNKSYDNDKEKIIELMHGLMHGFQEYLVYKENINWQNSSSIKELMKLSSFIANGGYTYMQMSTNAGENHFKLKKDARKFLEPIRCDNQITLYNSTNCENSADFEDSHKIFDINWQCSEILNINTQDLDTSVKIYNRLCEFRNTISGELQYNTLTDKIDRKIHDIIEGVLFKEVNLKIKENNFIEAIDLLNELSTKYIDGNISTLIYNKIESTNDAWVKYSPQSQQTPSKITFENVLGADTFGNLAGKLKKFINDNNITQEQIEQLSKRMEEIKQKTKDKNQLKTYNKLLEGIRNGNLTKILGSKK